MKLSVTGDIHGDVFLLFGMTESMSDEEMLFVAGDFGMFWYDTKICQEKMLIINDILESKILILFLLMEIMTTINF